MSSTHFARTRWISRSTLAFRRSSRHFQGLDARIVAVNVTRKPSYVFMTKAAQ